MRQFMFYKACLIWFSFIIFPVPVWSQAVPDTLFIPEFSDPAFPDNTGPEIHIDAAHNNYHTTSGRFAPFALVLRKEGYRIAENTSLFSAASLKTIHALVISNAIHEINQNNWSRPIESAFSDLEIQSIKTWVENGGRLLLIADHMPFGGAAQKLSAAFGFDLCDCFAMDNRRRAHEFFTRKDGTLLSNEITNSTEGKDYIDSIVTFTGSAFKIPEGSIPLLKLKNYTLLYPEQAWQFTQNTPYENCENYYQGAALNYGKGKIVLMGEAAMFTAQIAGNQKVGMNSPAARQNLQLLRNTVRWMMKE